MPNDICPLGPVCSWLQIAIGDAGGCDVLVNAMAALPALESVQKWGCMVLGHLIDHHAVLTAAIL
jgi:hypothetical protein